MQTTMLQEMQTIYQPKAQKILGSGLGYQKLTTTRLNKK